MTESERRRWNERYAEGDYVPRTRPSPFLEEYLNSIPVGGRALDLACGTGRNALRIAEAGFEVDAVDISDVAVATGRAEAERRGLRLNWTAADLDSYALATGAYRLITVFRFRDRALWPRLVDAVASDGFIIVEHHLRTSLDVDGPSDERFRLEPQELLRAFEALRILHYSEVVETGREERAYALQRVVACNGDPGF